MVLSYCSNCNRIFESRAILVRGDTVLTLSNNKETCPYCGNHNAGILDGTFRFRAHGVVELLSGPQFTKDRLLELKKLVDRSLGGAYTPEEIKEKLDKSSPELIGLFSAWPKTLRELNPLLMFLSAIIGWLGGPNFTLNINSPTYNISSPVLNSPKSSVFTNPVQKITPKAIKLTPQKKSSFIANKKNRHLNRKNKLQSLPQSPTQ